MQPVEGGERAPGEGPAALGFQQGHEQHLVLEGHRRLLLVAAPLQPKAWGQEGKRAAGVREARAAQRARPRREGSPWLRKATSSGGT